MTGKIRPWLPMLLALQAATGCSTIKSWFPDKEKDYQFRTEIPELVIPEDLKGGTLPSKTPEQIAAAAVAAAERPVAEPAEPVRAAKPRAPEKAEAPKAETSAAEQPAPSRPAAGAAVSSLQIDQDRKQAWRLVSRAMSLQHLEIVERNLDKGYFYVKYDPDAAKPQSDESMLDEIAFIFGGDPSQEQEYRITLTEIAAQTTEVTVQDSSGTTLSNSAATSLLKLITDGINQDLPKDAAVPGTQPSP